MIACAVEEDELLGILHRQHAQQDFVHEREDGRVRADAEGDRHDRDEGEERVAGEAAEGIANVPKKMRHKMHGRRGGRSA